MRGKSLHNERMTIVVMESNHAHVNRGFENITPNKLAEPHILLWWITAQEQTQRPQEKALGSEGVIRSPGLPAFQLCHSWTSELRPWVLDPHPESGGLRPDLPVRITRAHAPLSASEAWQGKACSPGCFPSHQETVPVLSLQCTLEFAHPHLFKGSPVPSIPTSLSSTFNLFLSASSLSSTLKWTCLPRKNITNVNRTSHPHRFPPPLLCPCPWEPNC